MDNLYRELRHLLRRREIQLKNYDNESYSYHPRSSEAGYVNPQFKELSGSCACHTPISIVQALKTDVGYSPVSLVVIMLSFI